MRGVSVEKMSMDDLRLTVEIMGKRGGGFPPKNWKRWSRRRCIEWLQTVGMPEWGVGEYCRSLLKVVTGKTEPGGFPVGLGYAEIVAMVRRQYPESAVDSLHLRWYATRMRADGEMIPVHRKRSRWKDEKTN